MPILKREDAPTFDVSSIRILGLAAPSRGSAETMMWRMTFPPDEALPAHTHDHEEVFHVLDGHLAIELDGVDHELEPGDTAIVPAGTLHRAHTEAERAELLSAMPVGTVMIREDGERTAPPWTR